MFAFYGPVFPWFLLSRPAWTLTSAITPQSDTEAACASRPLVSVSVIDLQQNQPERLSEDSQTHNEPSDEALICRKTLPTWPAEWFLGRSITTANITQSDFQPRQVTNQVAALLLLACHSSPADLSLWPRCLWSAWTLSLWLEIDLELTP